MMFQQTRTRRHSGVSFIAGVIFLAVGLLVSGHGNSQTPTQQQQLQIYRNLPVDQQKALLDSVGRGDARSDKKIEFPQTVAPRSIEDGATASNDLRLKKGDTLLLYVEIRKFEGREPTQAPVPPPTGLTGDQLGTSPQFQPQPQPQPQVQPRTPVSFTADRIEELNLVRERIQRRNPYSLDAFGALNLPESGSITLAGLTVEEAQQRLSVSEQLKDFKIVITRLPVQPQGAAALKPFGYDLFAGTTSTFAPATDVPVPADYVVGPGDTLQIQLVGNAKGNYSLTVDREGKISFPDLGPIVVGGMHFEAMRAAVERRVREQMIGTKATVTIGELRSIRIFILGDAERPGSYTVSGLSTMTNALLVSGGVKTIGSLRNIELKRGGATVTRLDLYDLLLKGDTRSDARLLPGDVIFINPIGATVSVSGEVQRPAIYELAGETSAKEIIALAGGLTAQADASLSTLERIDDQRHRVTLDVNLLTPADSALALRNADVLRVPGIRPVLEQSVSLSGYVYRAGSVQYHTGMRLSDLLPHLDDLRPNADQHYILIRRELPPNRTVAVFSADLVQALAMKGSTADVELLPRDQVHVFDLESGRDSLVEPLLRELSMQSNFDAPTAQVRVGGKVKVPGLYPLERGMRVSDLIRAGGSLDESAYEGQAELTRYAVINGEARQTEQIPIDLKGIRAGNISANIEVRPFDYLLIKEVPLWSQQEEVELKGEVRFPGKYPIHRGETLRSVLRRAGGLTELAFIEGAVFTRLDLKERERKQIDSLANRMQSDLAQISLQASQEPGRNASSTLSAGQALLTNLRATMPVGRLVIDLPRAFNARAGSSDDIVLKNGDQLIVPRAIQEVTVLGEVQSGTSHLFSKELDRDDYINRSGGFTQRADKKHTYVVKADGSVVAKNGNSWFSANTQMHPGDTIVVPLDAERMRPLPLWQAVTTIIYNLAIAAAAVNSF